MFGFSKKHPPFEAPSEKQLRYAKRLGINVREGMDKWQLCEAISDIERANPQVKAERERIKSKARERKFGKELIDLESKWNQFADDPQYMLAIYKRRKEIVVDVLQVNEATITKSGKLRLGVAAPKVSKQRYIGRFLEWEKCFELPIESLLYFEAMAREFYVHDGDGYGPGNKLYAAAVSRGLKIARKLSPKTPFERETRRYFRRNSSRLSLLSRIWTKFVG